MFGIFFYHLLVNLIKLCIVIPVNDLKSSGFLDNLSYENKKRTRLWRSAGHKAVCKQLCKRSTILLLIPEVTIPIATTMAIIVNIVVISLSYIIKKILLKYYDY